MSIILSITPHYSTPSKCCYRLKQKVLKATVVANGVCLSYIDDTNQHDTRELKNVDQHSHLRPNTSIINSYA